jgi:transcription elongation factor Elf1
MTANPKKPRKVASKRDQAVRPCPFCGAWPVLTKWESRPRRWSLDCGVCGIIMERCIKRTLFRAWNLRATYSEKGNPHLRSRP